ncbi:MAG: hypothetical protein QM773_00020 [Hyphomonadaceae bacterium]
MISATGNIQEVHIVGNILGGDGRESGSIRANGKVEKVTVDQDVLGGDGDDSGSISGDSFVTENGRFGGNVGTVVIHGNLMGGVGSNSGSVGSGGTMGTVTVDGNIQGGQGDFSGSVISGRTINKVTVGGMLQGGIGTLSGVIESDGDGAAGNIGTISVTGTILGGQGNNSGSIFGSGGITSVIVGAITGGGGTYSGGVSAEQSIGTLTVNGNVLGSSGDEAGKIAIGGSVTTLTINGNVTGSTGVFTTSDTGAFLGQIYVGGTLKTGTINGDLVGGGISTGGDYSGTIRAGAIQVLTINGDVVGGNGPNSGSIEAFKSDIGSLTVTGSVTAGSAADTGRIAAARNIGTVSVDSLVGSSTQRAVIEAKGVIVPKTNADAMTIQSVTVLSSMTDADIKAGYGLLDFPQNPDAQIGKVTVGRTGQTSGLFSNSNIVAGAGPGLDGRFGTADDPPASADVSSASIISKIVSVIINGTVTNPGNAGGPLPYGIVSQQVNSVVIAGVSITLQAGPSNDNVTLSSTTTTIFEVPLT